MMQLTLKVSGFSRPREFTKPVGLKKNPFWRPVSKICGFGVRIHRFHVDKSVQFQKYPDWCGRGLTQNLSYCNALFAAFKQALGSRDTPGLPCNNPEKLLLSLGDLCEDYMGGSSGVVSQYQSALDLRTRTSTSTRFNLMFFLVFSKKDFSESFILLCSPKKLVRLLILKEVKPSPDSKMIKLLTFDNLFPPLRHSR